ncbi:hypothetical protein CGG93_17245 [Vibrio parahaemolyticus]|nr:hypothetical protein BIW15_07935 [Vibrio sp. SALL6]TON86434.1 hypothetical protein CGH48_18660 [Vibrio parahaemolyticus]TOQ69117.1 hypothetical protein CGG93_17245 [Vibrio parahaemolyticus]
MACEYVVLVSFFAYIIFDSRHRLLTLAHSHQSTNLIDEMGVNPRQRMAHASDKTTQIYTDSHDVEWHEVPAISVAI